MRLWIGMVILALALVACGEDEQQGVQLQAVNSGAEETNGDAETAGSGDIIAQIEGAFVYAQGSRLYYIDPRRAASPTLLSDAFDLQRIAVSPGGDRIIFESDDLSDGVAHAMDLATLTARDVPTAIQSRGANNWIVQSWSPDEQWTVDSLFPLGLEAVKWDGSAAYELPVTQDGQAIWLADNNLLLVDLDQQPDGVTIFRGVAYFDLATGTATALEFDKDALAADFDAAVRAIADAHGYAFANPDTMFSPGGIFNLVTRTAGGPNPVAVHPPEHFFAFDASSSLCDSWTFWSAAPDTAADSAPLYQTEAYLITDFQILDNGDWLWLEWDLPDCRISKAPVVALTRMTPGGDPRILTEDVFTFVDLSRARNNLAGSHRYALSPDQRFVAWVGGSIERGAASLNITDLDSGVTVALQENQGATNDDLLFKAVFWVTP